LHIALDVRASKVICRTDAMSKDRSKDQISVKLDPELRAAVAHAARPSTGP
jgi:hypothetical protein